MDSFLGKWRLIKNNDFNLFLIFTQTSWIERTVAENSNINVEIKKITDKSYSKSIESYFYNANENIKLDNTYKLYDKLKKRYSYNENKIQTDIIGTIVNWNENIFVNKKDQLVIEYVWSEDNLTKKASQIFEKQR
tara:strand:+ start:119 stop:523 length:405 start_codon:yes stop_codon:yes gene_type:complete